MATWIGVKLIGVTKWGLNDSAELENAYKSIHQIGHGENGTISDLLGFSDQSVSKSGKTLEFTIATHKDYSHILHGAKTMADLYRAIASVEKIITNIKIIEICRSG